MAIVDTDCHHADGTRDIFGDDRDVLHICFCYQNYSNNHNNVDVLVPYDTSDEEYLSRVRQEFVPRLVAFEPEYVFWEFGYDATLGSMGIRA